MLTLRFAVILFASTISISNASAQLVHTAVGAHPRFGQPLIPKGATTLGALPFTVSQSGPNSIQLNTAGQYTFECSVRNTSLNSVPIYFRRTQLLPLGWNSSVCWGTTCYADNDTMESYTIPPFDSASLSLNVFPCLSNVADSTVIWLRVGVVGSATDTVLLPFSVSFVPADPPLVFQWSGMASANPIFDTTFTNQATTYTLANLLENGYPLGADYYFTIQDSLPVGWTLQTCLQTAYGTNCASNGKLNVNFSDYGDSTYQQKVKFTLSVPSTTSRDSAIIYFGVHPRISTPADSATYRFAMVVQSESGVSSPPESHAGLVVTNAWPNPLHPASTLHLEILSDQGGAVNAGVYDLDGVLKGTIELGQLSAGTNELQTTMPDLPSGEYIIRIQQGTDSPEIVRINYIK